MRRQKKKSDLYHASGQAQVPGNPLDRNPAKSGMS
jgi:hypothetical protein